MDGRRLFPGTPEPRTKRRKEENAKNLIYPKTHRLFPKPTGPWVHSHDESTNRNNHKRSNPRQSHGRKTLPPIEIVPGVSRDDLPFAGEFSNPTTRKYDAIPVVRALDWQTDNEGKPIRKELKNVVSRKAAFVQTRGEEASEPCAFCKAQKGIWKTCVVGVAEAEEKFDGSCANCRFSRRAQCDYRTTEEGILGFIDRESEPSERSSYVASSLSPTTRSPSVQGEDKMSLDIDLEEVTSLHELGPVLPQKRVPRASGRALEAADNLVKLLEADEENEILSKAAKIKNKSPALSTPWRSTMLDSSVAAPSAHPHEGEVVAFPLDREAFNDLSLLKRAKSDLLRHISRISKRIEQIEGIENPWDLI